jgi:outer membrane receptor protein involved in Fe transport
LLSTVLVLLLGSATPAFANDLTGTAKDAAGGALVGAQIIVMTPQRAVVATVTTDQAGKFTITGLADGQYLVLARYPSLAERQAPVTVGKTPVTLDLVLEVAPVGQDVTVTASPGGVESAARVTQQVNLISAEDILERAKTVVAQAVDGETAVNLQRTSPGMAGIFVRGLTGNKVNVYVDGVRYSNGAQRGGVSTFLDLIDASTLENIEVLRGTSSAQYGSDALGGSVQFLTKVAPIAAEPKVGGSVTFGGETGHNGGFGSGLLSYGRPSFGVSGSFSGRKTGDYRPGDGGNDSHAASLRFLGVETDRLYTDRMPDTGFTQTAGQVRANWVVRPNISFVANYLNTRQDGANRWDQIDGGDGNLIAELNDLQLDLAYARLEISGAGFLDHASFTYSFNTQREERVNQGGSGSSTAAISHEPERTTVNGLQFNGTRRLSDRSTLMVGADAYFEKLTSDAFNVNPATGAITDRRPRVPDQATYQQIGGFGQITMNPNDKLVVTGAARVGYNAYNANASDAPVDAAGKPLWPDDSLDETSFTYRIGAAYTPKAEWTVMTALSRGYRAPHMTDLGTLGLTGSGFEVAAPDISGRTAFVGTTADANAASTGRAVEQVTAETSLNFDAALRYSSSRAKVSVGMFVNNIHGNIQKQALILEPGAVGTTIGGETITQQTPNGAVFVAAAPTVPVLVRANFDEARIWGFELSADAKITPSFTAGGTYTYMEARDLGTDLPPNIEGGTPAPGGTAWVRYMPSGSRWWVEPYLVFAADQPNLSTLDLGDRRTGASRSRTNIQNFFRNGARNRGWINPGVDGVFGNADDILIETGETLAQVQDRVLGVGVNSAPMYTAVQSFTVFGIRAGMRFGPHTILIDFENLSDEVYRGISWGMDGSGRGITARYMLKF